MKKAILVLTASILGLIAIPALATPMTYQQCEQLSKSSYNTAIKIFYANPSGSTAARNAYAVAMFFENFGGRPAPSQEGCSSTNGVKTCYTDYGYGCSNLQPYAGDPTGVIFNKPLSNINNQSLANILENGIKALKALPNTPPALPVGTAVPCTYPGSATGDLSSYQCSLQS